LWHGKYLNYGKEVLNPISNSGANLGSSLLWTALCRLE